MNSAQLASIIGAAAHATNPYQEAQAQGAQQMKLQQYLKGQVGPDGAYQPGVESAASTAAQNQELEQAKGIVGDQALAPGRKINARIGQVDLSEAQQQVPVMAMMAQQKMKTQQENQYAKGLEKYSDVNGALTDLERVTNRDGQGGVLTNPNSSLISAGRLESSIPDTALGIGEALGAVPAGTSEERKALARVKLSLGHAMTGARMNPTMQKMIQDSLGGITSGDPQLMAKGLRGAAGIVGSQVNTVQSGFSPETQGAVHDRLGGDPMDFYRSIVKDAPLGSSQPTAQAPQQPPQAQQQAPQQAQAPQFNFDAEDKRRAALNVQKSAQQSSQNPPQGQ